MKTTIISVGGGGYNIANGVRKSGLFAGASFLSCDTDKTALNEYTNAYKRFLLERCCEKETNVKPNSVRDLLVQTGDTLVLCATLGGLTGSTYAPIIAHEALRAGKFVCSLFSMPWDFEGVERNRVATAARATLLAASDFAIQQNNDRLRAVWKGTRTMLDMADQGLIDVLKSVLSSRTLEDWAMEPEQKS